MAELKPCPFCGGEAEPWQPLNGGWMIRCKKCASKTGLYRLLNVAVEKWNKRTERPKGRWVLDKRTGVISCPYCKHLTAIVGNNELYEEAVYEHNFCSFCGADMRGESE